MNEEKMLGILMKQDQVVGKTKLISGVPGGKICSCEMQY